MDKLKNIEFLRVILIAGIVLLHSYINRNYSVVTIFPEVSLFDTLRRAFCHSNNGVDAFFIIAGCLLVLTFKNSITIKDFIIKKYIRMSPVILFAVGICFIGFLFSLNNFPILGNLLTIFLLRCPFVQIANDSIGVTWFTSALFTHLLMYFLILKYLPVKYKYWLMFLLMLFGYITLEVVRHGKYATPSAAALGLITVGNLRAFGGVGLGCFIGLLYKNFKDKIANFVLNSWQRVFVTLLELSSLLFIFWWSFIIHKKINNIVYVLVFALLFITFLFKQGYISRFFEKDIWVKLARYQYSIYVTHILIIRFMNLGLWKHCPEIVVQYPWLQIGLNIFIILVVGILTYHYVEKPATKYFTQKIKCNKVVN